MKFFSFKSKFCRPSLVPNVQLQAQPWCSCGPGGKTPNPLRFPESLAGNTGLGPVALLTGGELTLLQCLLGCAAGDTLGTETAVLGKTAAQYGLLT